MEKPINYGDYRKGLVKQMWTYRQRRFAGLDRLFDRPMIPDERPPVFITEAADHNVIVRPDAEEDEKQRVLSQIRPTKRQRFFRSMWSSQALAQSVFGSLEAYGKLGLLSGLVGENDTPLFFQGPASDYSLQLEYETKSLDEPRRTSVDVLFHGPQMIAIECKLGETEVGACSQVPSNCDGDYIHRKNREHRCYLTQRGIAYWKFIPELFKWSGDKDQAPCLLRLTYQLVRNVLVACMRSDNRIDPSVGYAVLLYDDRNPAFQPRGEGWKAFALTKGALKEPMLLRSCTWQEVVAVIRQDRDLAWLSEELRMKYGL